MKIAIAGGSGFVGQYITDELVREGHEVLILTRKKKPAQPSVTYIQWLKEKDAPELELEGVDAIINLAGTSINSGRWSEKRKQDILSSRMKAVRELKRIIEALPVKPKVFLNASAVGYYGTSREETFTEEDIHTPSDFLSSVTYRWEKEASRIEALGIRTVFMRFGLILGEKEGALPRMSLPYRLFAGGTIGSGSQWISWIHVRDAAGAAVFCLKNKNITGPVNFTAPVPVTMKEFGKAIGETMRRPHWFPVPSPLIRASLGEMSIIILEGQYVLPVKLEAFGYSFKYPTHTSALQNILS